MKRRAFFTSLLGLFALPTIVAGCATTKAGAKCEKVPDAIKPEGLVKRIDGDIEHILRAYFRPGDVIMVGGNEAYMVGPDYTLTLICRYPYASKTNDIRWIGSSCPV